MIEARIDDSRVTGVGVPPHDVKCHASALPSHSARWLFSELLTEDEAIRYLRLDTINGLKNPRETLARYRARGFLKGTQVSKSVFYRRIELDRFLDRLTLENPR